MTVLILHGIEGFAGIHWQRWLHDELKARDYKVSMPTLPDTNHPTNKQWRDAITSLIRNEDLAKLILVAHSMGVPAALEVIQHLKEKIAGFISVGGFYTDYGADLNSYFMSECRIDISKTKKNINKSFVIYGDDDPYVPQQTLKELADSLGVKPIVIKKGGHLNTDAGYTEFPLLLELISRI